MTTYINTSHPFVSVSECLSLSIKLKSTYSICSLYFEATPQKQKQ
ncbi:hypothetical protein HMPREF0973_02277 [Prevotella veroralis F0319]|uniref:Uncharacterized protein n=1 Tax=Prevotella veroralis F0319 TaxID=649761 RepID=C9MRL4_9BACT|nr:hypothetical protein HMPREF0973_02277 [Prevotella veroralis F0319]